MAFATTNIDDIFILLVLFSQVRTEVIRKEGRAVREKATRKKLYIVIGQYLGFSMIIFLSIIGSLSSFFIPVSWIGLLGFVPIYMGVKDYCHFVLIKVMKLSITLLFHYLK